MTEETRFDIVVLGGGPGGYTAAFRAADLGLSVCLVEARKRLGGVCLNVGCIPSKTLLHAAVVIEEAAEAEDFGVSFGQPQIDLDRLRAKKTQVIEQLTGGLDKLCSARGVTRLEGTGSFTDSHSLAVKNGEEATIVTFDKAVIATGSRPFSLPFAPDDKRIWDSTDALTLDSMPERLLIIGGGIIGLEMAQIYKALGSDITIIEMESQIIPPADKDLVQPLFLKLKKRYTILTDTKVTTIETSEKAVKISFEGKKNSGSEEFDAVLVAVGRRPNSESIGLENIEVSVDARGFIPVDEQQRTTVDHVFAIGDVV